MNHESITNLWGLPEPPNTVTFAVRRLCGHVEQLPFEGTETSNEAALLPAAEVLRLDGLRASRCIHCD